MGFVPFKLDMWTLDRVKMFCELPKSHIAANSNNVVSVRLRVDIFDVHV